MSHKIAIIGAGPAGCYVAQSLVKASPDAEITIIERLPTPYGLIRYGVAADHQGTKGVSRQFSRLFERQGVNFIGNLEVGKDISLEELQNCMDAVVIATGLYADREIDVQGNDLKNIYGAGEISRFWNAHPDSELFQPSLGKTVAVFGNGNVAMDIIRLLAKPESGFEGSDFNPSHVNDQVSKIHVIGRSPLEHAKFDPVLIHELKDIEGLNCSLAQGDFLASSQDNPTAVALAELLESQDQSGSKEVVFHSGWQVEAFCGGKGCVNSVLVRNSGSNDVKTIECDSVITAIGFEDSGTLDRDMILSEAEGAEDGIISQGTFMTGWFKRGPSGTIPENRTDSQKVAKSIISWLESTVSDKPGKAAILEQFGHRITSYEDWLAIDRIETRFGGEKRCRQKISSWKTMMAAIEQQRNAV
ncbi:MAG: FAD-dependent oxidoreductase [Pseudomonadota bacterium]